MAGREPGGRVVGPHVGCRVHLVTHHVCGSFAGSGEDILIDVKFSSN